ncbi:hypothetical protein K456DRAFT_268075 [Colletotrichum gloeosporioides 23]|nr:hypothetical protein K456DRAFT_268075 [Colletotrichum gloeosporioides 23]
MIRIVDHATHHPHAAMALFNEGKGKPGQAKARMTACLPTRTRRALALALQRREALLKNDRTAHVSQSPLVPCSPPGCAHLIKMQTKYLRRRPRERGQVSSILHGVGGAWTSRRQPSLGAAILNGPACQAMSCRPGAGVRRALYMPCTPSFPYRPGSLSHLGVSLVLGKRDAPVFGSTVGAHTGLRHCNVLVMKARARIPENHELARWKWFQCCCHRRPSPRFHSRKTQISPFPNTRKPQTSKVKITPSRLNRECDSQTSSHGNGKNVTQGDFLF